MTREDLIVATLQSSLLFVSLWALFRLIPSVPAGAKAWMWRLAFLKPLLALLPFAAVTLRVLPTPEAPATTASEPTSLSTYGPVRTGGVPEPAPAPRSQADPLLIAWLVGAAGAAAYSALGMRKTLRIAARANVVDRADLNEALAALLQRADVRNEVRLLSSPELHSAMLIGGRRCSIVIPERALERDDFQDLRLMLAHEVAHIARRDLMWFGLASVVQSLYFFNPLVWVAVRCSRLDHESATDNYASQIAGVPIRTYAEMLLRATVVARHPQTPGSLPVAESYRTIHRRLKAMKHFNSKPSFWRTSAMAAVALLTVALLPAYQFAAASPAKQPPAAQTADTMAPAKYVDTMAANAKPAKAVKTAKTASNTEYATLPIKVVKKNGKSRYYVKTTKGYVEIAKPSRYQAGPAMASAGYGRPGTTLKPDATMPRDRAVAINPAASAGSKKPALDRPVSTRPGAATGSVPYSEPARSDVAQATGTKPAATDGGATALATKPGIGESGGVGSAAVDGAARSEPAKPINITSLEFDREDVTRALITLFKSLRVPYTIAPEVKGTVTLKLENVTLEQALQAMLRMVGATYRVEGGVYVVVSRSEAVDAQGGKN